MAKKENVKAMFDGIAPRYDLLNHLLSLGIDRRWRRNAVRQVAAGRPAKILDVATGTADLAIAIARALPEAQVTGVDLSPEMLAVGRRKAMGLAVELREGDATALDFADGTFDAVSAAFGVRNFEHVEKGVGEMVRVLKTGGRLVVLEFSMPRDSLLARLFRLYFHRILPAIGGIVSGDGAAYRYLPESVDGFPAPAEFLKLMERSGLQECRAVSLTGGIAQIYVGIRE